MKKSNAKFINANLLQSHLDVICAGCGITKWISSDQPIRRIKANDVSCAHDGCRPTHAGIDARDASSDFSSHAAASGTNQSSMAR